MSSTSENGVDARLGDIIAGRYRLVRRLGAGGMGEVYAATHLELDQEVAIKLLTLPLARHRSAVERFQREARTASRIKHPNVVTVFDLGRAADGTPYLAMELLEGHNLEVELKESGWTLPCARVLEVLEPVARALDVCHARGVVHRDIKPSNIFLARLSGGALCPKIVDFGLAMLHATDERLTQTGIVAGTPYYMAPEASDGSLGGPAADIYSLAVMAYESLCGALPFDADVPSGVLVKKVLSDAPPMSVRSGRSFPPPVEAVMARGLARDPSQRPSTAMRFIRELSEAIESREVHVASGAPPQRRRTVALGIGVTMFGVTALGVGIGALALRQPDRVDAWGVAAAATTPAATTPAATTPAATTPAATTPAGETRNPPQILTHSRDGHGANPLEIGVDEGTDPQLEGGSSPQAGPNGGRPHRVRDRALAVRLTEEGRSALIRGDVGRAVEVLERARAADGRYAPALRTLGLAYERGQHPAAARRAYQVYLRLAPRAGDAPEIRRRLEALR